MNQKEIVQFCKDNIERINAANQEDKETLFDNFITKLRDELEGVDYIEFKDGVITNNYINFDSYCELTFVSASIDMSQFIENMDLIEKEDESNLNYAARLISEIENRDEDWEDLVNEDYSFNESPEYIGNIIASVMCDWEGEEDFTEEIEIYLKGVNYD